MNLSEVHAARIIKGNKEVRTISGSMHRVMIRRFKKPVLDDDYKEAIITDQVPTVELAVLAKVRALSEREMTSTEIGYIQKGDLFVEVDPDVMVGMLDEMRFTVDAIVDGEAISRTWDYVIKDIKHGEFSHNVVSKSFVASRKMEQTAGGTKP